MAYIPQHYERAEEAALSRDEIVADKRAKLHSGLQELFKLGLSGDAVKLPCATMSSKGKFVETFEDFRTVMEWCLTDENVMRELILSCQCEFPENRLRYLAKFERAAAKCYADTYADDLAEIAADEAIEQMKLDAEEF